MIVLLSGKDGHLLAGLDIAESKLQRKPVHLGFRQWISAAKLDGILGRNYEEQVGEIATLPFDTDLAFAHGFQQRGLGSGRSPIDFVGQQNVCEHWTFMEMKLLVALAEHRHAQYVGGEKI